MKKFNNFLLNSLFVLGVSVAPFAAKAQVAFSLTSNGSNSTAVINAVTSNNGFVNPSGLATGNIAGTFVVIRVQNTQSTLTLNNFIGYNGYTNAGSVLPTGTKLVSGSYTYFLIDNSDAVSNPNMTFTANSTKPIIGFSVAGVTGTPVVEIAPLNDLVAKSLTLAYYGIDALNYSTSDIATPNRTISSINGTPLPISLLNFTAQKATAKRTLLSWVTASEEAADYFEVERSTTGSASSFRAIGAHVPATGNSKEERAYQAYDEAPVTGNNYYRLKMVDVAGTVTYSSTRIVRFDGTVGTESVSLFPNPLTVEGQDVKLAVNVLAAQVLEYSLVDVTGKLIYTGKLDVTAGTANYKITGFESIAAGSYFLRIKGTTLSDNIKVLKTN